MSQTTVTLCSSINFYEHVGQLEDQLKDMGFGVLIPKVAREMKRQNNYDVATFKPRVEEVEGRQAKTNLMHLHLDKVDQGDICLVVNNEKHGIPNYIGGNVLMEMALAFHQRKPVVLLNEIPEESVYLEEIIGMQPIVLHGDIKNLSTELTKIAAQKKQ